MDAVRSMISWILALGLIFAFLHVTIHPLPDPPPGQVKLFDPPGENILFKTMAERSGIALFEPAGRFAVAILELLAALMLLLPNTRRLGATLAFFVMAGAIAAHLSPWLGREVPTSLGADAPGDGGQQFMLAVSMLVASLLILVVHPSDD